MQTALRGVSAEKWVHRFIADTGLIKEQQVELAILLAATLDGVAGRAKVVEYSPPLPEGVMGEAFVQLRLHVSLRNDYKRALGVFVGALVEMTLAGTYFSASGLAAELWTRVSVLTEAECAVLERIQSEFGRKMYYQHVSLDGIMEGLPPDEATAFAATLRSLETKRIVSNIDNRCKVEL